MEVDQKNGWTTKKRKTDEEFWKDHPLQGSSIPPASLVPPAPAPVQKSMCSLQEEDLASVEQIYRIRLKDLKEWRETERKEIERRYEGLNFHYPAPTQFQIPNGRTACTCITVVTAYYFLTRAEKLPPDMDWTRILKLGRDLWEMYRNQHDDDLATVYNVIKLPDAEPFRKAILASEEIAGRMDIMDFDLKKEADDGCYSLEQACRKMRVLALSVKADRFAVAFTANHSTITLLFTNHWWLFDSHGVDRQSKSTLISFDKVMQLTGFLRRRHGVKISFIGENEDLTPECDMNVVFSMNLFTLN